MFYFQYVNLKVYIQCSTISIVMLRGVLGATSIEKIPKISASGRNFLDPFPPFEKGPYRRKCWYFVPNSNYKVFSKFQPPLFHQKAEPHQFLQLRWPLINVDSRWSRFHFYQGAPTFILHILNAFSMVNKSDLVWEIVVSRRWDWSQGYTYILYDIYILFFGFLTKCVSQWKVPY